MADETVVVEVSERGYVRGGRAYAPGELLELPPAAARAMVEANPPFGRIIDGEGDQTQGAVAASGRARELAAQHGINLRSLDGSGEGGRVLADDVREAARERAG